MTPATAQTGNVDTNGDIVDCATAALLERLREAICVESPIDVDEHLSLIAADLVRTSAL